MSTFDLLPVAKKSEKKLTAFVDVRIRLELGTGTVHAPIIVPLYDTKKQAKQLQKCGWWMNGIALLLAQNVCEM